MLDRCVTSAIVAEHLAQLFRWWQTMDTKNTIVCTLSSDDGSNDGGFLVPWYFLSSSIVPSSDVSQKEE
jgi:hypothetical protein